MLTFSTALDVLSADHKTLDVGLQSKRRMRGVEERHAHRRLEILCMAYCTLATMLRSLDLLVTYMHF